MGLWAYRRRRKRILVLILGLILFFFLIWGISSRGKKEKEILLPQDTIRIKVLDHLAGKVLELGLEEYLVGVVAAEMPASFPLEALKAQAVAARTYAARRIQIPDPRANNGEAQANLSSDPAVNQAWISDEEMRLRWGKVNYSANKKKIIEAILETKDQVLIYEGELIEPAYHASCGGVGTENSGNVWQYDLPYLQHVACHNHPHANLEEVKVFALQDFSKALNLAALPVVQDTQSLFVTQAKTASGRLLSFLCAGRLFSGAELRSCLDLKSTCLEISLEGSQVKVSTKGYGHGVGMCQHGAGAMAQEGKTFQQILTHYYTGVQLAKIRRAP